MARHARGSDDEDMPTHPSGQAVVELQTPRDTASLRAQLPRSVSLGSDVEEARAIDESLHADRHHNRMALISMFLLVTQGTVTTILLKISRSRPGTPYLGSIIVILVELTKLAACSLMQLRETATEARRTGAPLGAAVRQEFQMIAARSRPMALPAGLFVCQQLLIIVAATNLDVVAFQIFNQSFKVVPTALFAFWLLGQRLEAVQWGSIPVLALGVIMVTLNNGDGGGGKVKAAAESGAHLSSWFIGMLACSATGLSSAFAGVYFEQYVKGSNAASLAVRNIQLGMYGVPLSTGYALAWDWRALQAGGALQGFDSLTWVVIVLSACGGLVVGSVVKYCDNVVKNFALAVSVILTTLAAIPVFGQWPTPAFLLGVVFVLLSLAMYSKNVRLPNAQRLRLRLQELRKWATTLGGCLRPAVRTSLAVASVALGLGVASLALWALRARQELPHEQAAGLLRAGLEAAGKVASPRPARP